jgi:DNA-binding Lrp family transcriptional regulator
MDDLEFRLLNDFQRGFPLCRRPYETLAKALGRPEAEIIAMLDALRSSGKLSRVGATLAPGRIGAATLAAMAVPPERLEPVARLVNAFPEVNHNYEREHDYNLWFVVTAPDRARVDEVLRAIEGEARCGRALSLPMIEPYHIDLGFDLGSRGAAPLRAAPRGGRAHAVALTAAERDLVIALQEGLALVPEPYAELAQRAGLPEAEVMATLARWLQEGVINRLGTIVYHRQLGFRANAMVVWDVPDREVAGVGRRLAQLPEVTLCYRRERCLPHWRYNLYCMIHGHSRTQVLGQIAGMDARCELVGYPYEVLFSRRCFKQRGARYLGGGGAGREVEAGVAHG